MRRNKYKGILFLLPSLVGVLGFFLLPFLDVVRRSFTQAMGGGFVGLANYKEVLTNQAFLLASKNMLCFLALCLPLLLVLSLGVALLLQGIGNAAGIFESAYLLPLAIPAASIVLLWRAVFDGKGLLNGLLASFGIQGPDWMNSGAALGVLVFTYIWKNIGYDIVLWLAGLSSVPEELYEAARVDGAGSWMCFRKITLPLIRPISFTIVVLSFLNSFKVFRAAYLVAGNYPHDSIYLLQHLFNNWFRDLAMDKMSAGAVLLALAVIALTLCYKEQ